MKRLLYAALFLTLSLLLLIGCDPLGQSDETTTAATTAPVTTTAPVATTAPVTTATPVEEFLYKKNTDNTITIQAYFGTGSDIVIPAEIEGMPVSEIDNSAFVYPWCEVTLASVVLPNTLRKIGDKAFEGAAITEIELPPSLTHIGSRAFAECRDLTHITIPSDCLDDTGSEAFCNSGLESVTLAEGVTQIPSSAFANTRIREVILPSTVRLIKWQAFACCRELETVVLNEGLLEIADNAFYDTALRELTVPSSVERLSKYTFVESNNLRSLYFLGNAPDGFLDKEDFFATVYPDYVPPFTVYYYEGAEGFTAPTWYGIPSVEIPR